MALAVLRKWSIYRPPYPVPERSWLRSVELAPAKARTAALFRKPSKALEDAIHAGRTAAVTAGYVEMSGGLPLIVNGEIVGAIGVSSAQPDWDTAIAAAGAAILAAKRTH